MTPLAIVLAELEQELRVLAESHALIAYIPHTTLERWRRLLGGEP